MSNINSSFLSRQEFISVCFFIQFRLYKKSQRKLEDDIHDYYQFFLFVNGKYYLLSGGEDTGARVAVAAPPSGFTPNINENKENTSYSAMLNIAESVPEWNSRN
jgi:hypothetical protein